jgi:hypothetical protein
MRRVLNDSPAIDGSLQPEERQLVEDCLLTDPARRPKTAAELARRIDGLLAAVSS